MKEQITSAVLPSLPIVGTLKLSTRDGESLCAIHVVKKQRASKLNPFFQSCFEELHAFLIGKKPEISIPLDTFGLSPFQMKVLNEMKKIPYGQVETYKDLAQRMKSKGFQAIGSACGKNPFMLIYPCHRVVGSSGPGGFAHGLKMKTELLKLEQARS